MCSLQLERNEDLTSYNDLLVCFFLSFYFCPHAIVFLEQNSLACFLVLFVRVFTFFLKLCVGDLLGIYDPSSFVAVPAIPWAGREGVFFFAYR